MPKSAGGEHRRRRFFAYVNEFPCAHALRAAGGTECHADYARRVESAGKAARSGRGSFITRKLARIYVANYCAFDILFECAPKTISESRPFSD